MDRTITSSSLRHTAYLTKTQMKLLSSPQRPLFCHWGKYRTENLEVMLSEWVRSGLSVEFFHFIYMILTWKLAGRKDRATSELSSSFFICVNKGVPFSLPAERVLLF